MFRSTLRTLLAYRLRLALSALAIVLGVAFVAGTFVFTDSLQKSFDDLTTGGQPDLVVEPQTEFDPQFRSDLAPLTLPASLADTIATAPAAAAVAPQVVVRNVVLLGADGKPVSGMGGPNSSGSGASWTTEQSLNQWRLTQGQAPVGADQVVIDKTSAERSGFALGAPARVLLPSGAMVTPTVVGIAEPTLAGFGERSSRTMWDLATAESLLTKPGQVTSIRVMAQPGTSQQELQAQVAPLLPSGVTSQTGDQIASDLAAELDSRLGFLNTFLLVFGLISLFVSAFLIYNTFSILVAQRTKELALLRAIGATRGQVSRAVLLEALVVAIVATTIGLAVGAGVAVGLKTLFRTLGAPLPSGELVFLPRTFLVAYAIGLAVTLFSALVPARRASSIPPVAAMREDGAPASRPLLARGIVGAVLMLAAVGVAFAAFATTDSGTRAAALLGLSALAALIGALALGPVAAVVLMPVLGAPFRTVVGRLAKENARRNPRRTAATAGALMVGLALISAMSVLASSTIKSTSSIVDDVIGADFVVMGTGFQPFPPNVYDAAAGVPGIGVATYVRSAVAVVPGGDARGTIVTVVDPTAIADVLKIKLASGDLAALSEPGTTIVDTKTAAEQGITLGQTLDVTSLTGVVPLRVVGLYEPAGFFQGFAVGYDTGTQLGSPPLDSAIYLVVQPGQDAAKVRTQLEAALAPYPMVTVQDQAEFKKQIRDQINQLLAFIVALLVLAVLIAFLGIINTLALSVFERTREIGLLRAVGTTRPQIRRMILVESVLIAVLGCVLGIVLGVLYGAGLQRTLADDGISQLSIDVGQLVLFVVLAALGGVVAALWPAWRASRLNVLGAIASE